MHVPRQVLGVAEKGLRDREGIPTARSVDDRLHGTVIERGILREQSDAKQFADCAGDGLARLGVQNSLPPGLCGEIAAQAEPGLIVEDPRPAVSLPTASPARSRKCRLRCAGSHSDRSTSRSTIDRIALTERICWGSSGVPIVGWPRGSSGQPAAERSSVLRAARRVQHGSRRPLRSSKTGQAALGEPQPSNPKEEDPTNGRHSGDPARLTAPEPTVKSLRSAVRRGGAESRAVGTF
jgi:hypothetical protein